MRHEVKHLFVGKKERMWMTEVIIGNRAARVLVLGTSTTTSHRPEGGAGRGTLLCFQFSLKLSLFLTSAHICQKCKYDFYIQCRQKQIAGVFL